MKVLHFADLHLGVENYGRPNSATGLNTRLEDFLRSFDQLVDHAIEEDVDLVLFCGDAYKTRHPNTTCQREFAGRIKRLSDAGIKTVLLAGNHDVQAGMGKAHTLEIFGTLAVDNVIIADRPGRLGSSKVGIIKTKSGPVQIVVIPWPITSQLLTKDEIKGLTSDEVNELISEAIQRAISEEAAKLDPSVPSFLIGHISVFGATFGGERSVVMGHEVVLPLESVARREFNYVALGHLHRHQILHEDPPVIYSGSLEAIDFGEEAEQKGFLVVDVDSGETQVEFIPVDAREFQTIDVEVTGDEPTTQVLEAIAEQDIDGRVVRVIIHADEETAARLRDGEIHEALATADHVGSITKDIRRAASLRLGEVSYEKMMPLELLGVYLRTKEMPTPRIDELTTLAGELMTELAL